MSPKVDEQGRSHHRQTPQVIDQPSRETLTACRAVEGAEPSFTMAGSAGHHAERKVAQAAEHEGPQDADGPSVESTMGRHETFSHATPFNAGLLEETSLGRGIDSDPLIELGVQFDAFKVQWDAYIAEPENDDVEAQNAEDERLEALSTPLIRHMADQRAQGLAGFDVKLRVIEHCFEEPDDLSSEIEYAGTEDMRMMYSIMRDLVEWRGASGDLASTPAGGLWAGAPAPASRDAETNARVDALAALAPVLLPLIDECEARWVRLHELYAAGVREAGEKPKGLGFTDASLAWDRRCEEALNANGYKVGYNEAALIEQRIEALSDPYLEQPSATLEGIALKMRLAAVLPYFEESAKADLLRVQIVPLVAGGERA